METEKQCVYCTLPEIRAREIIGNDLAWVFPTNIPIVPGHVLVSPRRCVAKFADLTAEEIAAIRELAAQMQGALEQVYETDGFNFAWNEGKLAGQSVPHFHLHILPRKDGDTGLLGYDPRSFLYRTGDREPTAEAELLEVSKTIREVL